ncbi:hypothetical protein EDD16DRAFT_1694294 [Pisolithus croceorrhizus]|nr:hypothetical protein EDD16DRAFT_1694294 [Pisolithus croceorrhizus]KAI6169511.1 hypothetical protein EDD17DRAFT_1463477 [Pisolithus thermaeus]
MPKRCPSPATLPVTKRHVGPQLSPERHSAITFDSALYDELILFIFSFLDHRDLCAVEAASKNCSRLASDDQLWKALFLREFGRPRLRGGRGFYGRADGRLVKPLPSRAYLPEESVANWKWMYRISSNWRNGRCAVEIFRDWDGIDIDHLPGPIAVNSKAPQPRWHVLLGGTSTIFASAEPSEQPTIFVRDRGSPPTALKFKSQLSSGSSSISTMVLDQSPLPSMVTPRSPSVSLAVFLSTGEFFIYDHKPSAITGVPKRTYIPLPQHRFPVTHAAYHHPLLVTLSQSFTLMIYGLSGDTITHTQTLNSFTSHPPASVVLSAMSIPLSFKLVLAYAVPVYPSHWSVGATELIISHFGSISSSSVTLIEPPKAATPGNFVVSETRSARAFDVPQGWIDENKLQAMSAQWGRKVTQVADTQTDGKWVVLAPDDSLQSLFTASNSAESSSSSVSQPSDIPSTELLPTTYVSSPCHSSAQLQLYRLHLPPSTSLHRPKLTFVRTLHGPRGPISAVAVADGRCVSLGADGSIWVWDLESGRRAEVAAPVEQLIEEADAGACMSRGSGLSRGMVVFDERRIVSAGIRGIEERRFDV